MALGLSQRFDLPEIVGRILTARGVGIDQAAAFLEPRLRDFLPDPSHLIGMDEAAARLATAIEDGEPIGIIADYDVDGATSCALLTRFLRAHGASVHFDIPDRLEEGYGPNPKAFARLERQGCRLVVVLDAGTTAFDALEQADAAGHEVIVVDHHAAEQRLPKALAVINPNRLDQDSPLGDLAAVGVTFMLCVALSRALRQRDAQGTAAGPDLRQWLDLVALGTVCDLVPLTGLNRALVAQGVKVAVRGDNPGLAALASAAKLNEAPDAGKFGFVLGPRINAGGRTGQSSLGAKLLTDDDPQAVATIARQLDALNHERRRIEKDVLSAAERQLEPTLADASALVAAGEGWSPGVVGVVASRLVERYHRPAIVIGLDGPAGGLDGPAGGLDDPVGGLDGPVGKGSGRSIKGFDLGAAVIAARQEGLLEQGGGHPMAAGLTVTADKVSAFAAFIEERMTAAFGPGLPPPPELLLDAALEVQSLTTDLGDALDRLAPFGRGNPEPRLLLRNATLHQVRRIGDNHLDAWLAGATSARLRAVAFRSADQPLGEALLSADGRAVQLAGRLKIDTWQGRRRPSFQIEDAALS
ncbi:MAG: DHH family phosphoesterase [Alphaproteobacteria bacterium]|nr:DHH family phosphoesterase [Alphaproteobacteria bacterium]